MSGVTFYDEQGKPASLPPEAAQDAFVKGTHVPQKTQLVHVRLSEAQGGGVGTVPGEHLSEALAGGAQIVDPEAEAHNAAVEEEKGPAGTVRAASLGLVTGAGLGPGVIRKGISAFSPEAGKRFEHAVEINREANPIVTPVAEAAGFAATVAATRGKGPARVLPAVGIDAIGQIAERGAVRALGRAGGEGALAVAGRAAATHAVRGAAEGALITAGQSVDEDMLGDHEVNGEKAFVAGLKGGIFTGAFGGALGGAGSLVRSAVGRSVQAGARDLLHTAAEEFETKAETKAQAAAQDVPTPGGIAMGPSSLHNPEAYPNPYRPALNASDDLTERAAESPIKIGKERQVSAIDTDAGLRTSLGDADVGPLDLTEAPLRPGDSSARRRAFLESGLSGEAPPEHLRRLEAEIGSGYSEGAHEATDIFGLKKGHGASLKTGIEALEAPKGEKAFRIETDKAQLAANERLRLGDVPAEVPRPMGPAAQRAEVAKGFSSDMFGEVKVDKDLVKAQDLREVAASRGFFHDTADEAAWRTGGGGKKLSDIAEQRAGGTKAAGQTVRERGILDGGSSHEERLERTESALGQIGEEIGNTVGAAKVTVRAKDILRSVDAAIAPLEKSAASQGDARAVQVLRQDLYKTLGLVDELGVPVPGAMDKPIAFQDLVRERRALQSRVYSIGDPNATAMKRAGSEIAGAWNDLEAKALEEASAGSGDSFRALNKEYQQLSLYKKALDSTIAAGHANHRIGLLDHIAGHGAGMVGSALAGPLGHTVGAVVGALTNKMIRERGNFVAAKVLGKIADLGAVRSYAQAVDKAVDGAAKGLTSPREARAAAGTRTSGTRAPLAVRYRDAIKELDELQAHPQSVAERAMTHTEDLAAHAPKTAQSFTMTATRAATFLASKRPLPLGEPSMFSNREPSILDTDKAEYLQYHAAVKDLGGVLKRAENGSATSEDMEALREVTPEIHGQLQNKVMEEVAMRHAKGKPMPFKQRFQLGMLFDIDTDPSLDKATFKQLQANVYTAPVPEQPNARGGKSNAPRRTVKLPNQANPLDRLAQSGAGRK